MTLPFPTRRKVLGQLNNQRIERERNPLAMLPSLAWTDTGNRRLRRPIVPSAPIFLCAGHRTVRGSRRCLAAGTHMAGDSMSQKQRLVEYSFRPTLIVAMREAFQKACEAPQVADGAPGVTEGVARRILELAKAGETSPDRLYIGALRKLSH